MSTRMHPQRGLGLVELMVATALALVVVAGVATVYAGLKTSWQVQDDFADMQDSERLAITQLTQTVRLAGFSPDPLGSPAATALPAAVDAAFGALAAGQAVMGTTGAPDTLTIRFVADGDGVARDCLGDGSYARGEVVTNRITVDRKGYLTCKVNASSTQPLVGGIVSFGVTYGVDTLANCAPCQPRRVMTADQVTLAGAWGRVRTVRLTLRFAVPRGSPPWVEWAQNVALMN